MKQFLFVAAVALVSAVAVADDARSPSNVSSIRADQKNEAVIRKIYSEFAEAWNRHDAEALGKMWALDGDHVEPDGTVAKGRDAVMTLLEKQHQTIFKDTHLDLEIVDVWFITGDVALIDGTYELTGAELPDGTAIPTRNGRLSAVFLKERGKWAIAASRLMIPTELPYKKEG